MSGDLGRALEDRRAAVEAAERSGDTERLALAHLMVAWTDQDMGAWEDGRVAAGKMRALDPTGQLTGTAGVGMTYVHWMEGRPLEALTYVRAYAADARRREDLQGLSTGLALLADLALQVDQVAEAEAPAREAAGFLQVGGSWPRPGIAYGPLAEAVVRLATPDAEEILARAEREVEATEQYVARPQLLRARALLLVRHGQLDTAVDALEASAEIARSQQAGIQLGRTLDSLVAAARLREDADLAAQAQTELMHLIERVGPEVSALSWARHGVADTRRTAARRSAQGLSVEAPSDMLTPRQREVAVLIAQGLTNRQIAQALVIAEGTAGVHVDHILNKLGFRSRAQVGAWAAEHGLLNAAND